MPVSRVQSKPRDWSLTDQPISIRKAQSRKKAHKPLRTSWISQKMCLPCLIIIHTARSRCDLRFVLCSRDLDVLRAQRIIGFFILITHKSARSENPITWLGCGLPFEETNLGVMMAGSAVYIECCALVLHVTPSDTIGHTIIGLHELLTAVCHCGQ